MLTAFGIMEGPITINFLEKGATANNTSSYQFLWQYFPFFIEWLSYFDNMHRLDEPDTQDTAGEARTNTSVMYTYGPPHMAKQKQDDQLEHTYSSYVRILDVALKTCQKWWMIGRSGDRGSGISMLAAWHDDDDDENVVQVCVCITT